MPVEEFITNIFCLIDDLYNTVVTSPLRRRGTPPKLSDSEVIAMEIAGEWLDHHHDKGIYEYFKKHWEHLFPNLSHRTQFVRQAANLWVVKQKLHQYLVRMLGAGRSDIHLVDGFPMDVCVRTRANRSKVYKGQAAYGYCASKKKSFYGFHGHLLTDARGVAVDMTVTAANIDERDSIYDLLEGIKGLMIGDKGYIRPELKQDCESFGIDLQTPLRKNMKDKRPRSVVRKLMNIRRRIETVIGQLAEYFELQRVRTRDEWHLTSRVARKLLGITVGIYLNIQSGHEPMQFEGMLSA